MVYQTSEFEVLGAGSTFNKWCTKLRFHIHIILPSDYTWASWIQLTSSRPVTALKLPHSFPSFSEGWAVTLRRWVTGSRRFWGSLWAVNDLRSFETSRNIQRLGIISQNIRIISNNDTKISYLPKPRCIFSPCRPREYVRRRIQILKLLLSLWAACSPKRPLDKTGCPQKSVNRIPNG